MISWIFRFAILLCLIGATFPSKTKSQEQHYKFHVGAIVADDTLKNIFRNEVKKANAGGLLGSPSFALRDVIIEQEKSPMKTALSICKLLIPKKVWFIVTLTSANETVSTSVISYTGGYYFIPVIDATSRQSSYSNKNIHRSYMRTVPPYSHQAAVWVTLLRELQYKQVILIYASDADGRALLSVLQNNIHQQDDDASLKISSLVEFEPGLASFFHQLLVLKNSPVKTFLLYADLEDADIIFHDAFYVNMTGQDYVWVVTEQALRSEWAPVGTIGLKLRYTNSLEYHAADVVKIIAGGLKDYQENVRNSSRNITQPPTNCDTDGVWDETGIAILRYINLQVVDDGRTGKVAFDENGDRLYAEYDIVNIQNLHQPPLQPFSYPVSIGSYSYRKKKMELVLNRSQIIWPGNTSVRPAGFSIASHLQIVTIEEIPFLFLDRSNCVEEGGVLCYAKRKNDKKTDEHCCSGYCVDLIETLAEMNNFTYDLFLSPDGKYGSRQVTQEGNPEWNGMIGELLKSKGAGDMIGAPLTINPERAQVIEFSKPFKYQGIMILVKRPPEQATFISVLQPFQNTLWVLLLGTVNVIAVCVWIVDRCSPFYRKEGDENNSLSLVEAMWFSWGIILSSGLGEGTPRCLSARVLGLVWAGFAMILVASYTANLATFLVLEGHTATISGISDAKLRNPAENYTFATVKGSAVDMFFKRKTEWANMYRVMEENNYDTAEAAIEAVAKGRLQAFIYDSTRLEYEASQNCDLITVGDLFGMSGYGFGLKKDSPWVDKITLDILSFQEGGFIEELDNKWIWRDKKWGDVCEEEDSGAPLRLGLSNLEGIFMIVIFGTVAGIFLILTEILWKKYTLRSSAVQKTPTEGSLSDDSDLSAEEIGFLCPNCHTEEEIWQRTTCCREETLSTNQCPYECC